MPCSISRTPPGSRPPRPGRLTRRRRSSRLGSLGGYGHARRGRRAAERRTRMNHGLRHISRRALMLAVPLAAAAIAAGCTVPPPPGAAPLRYRDVIFPNLTITSGLVYGSAPDAVGNPVTLTLDMYRPTGDTQTSRPAIVLVHGGGFYSGDSTNAAMVKM